jgi:hypothetical protein
MTKIVTALALLLCLVAFTPQASAAPPSNSSLLAIPVTGTGAAGTLNGVFRIVNFSYSSGQVFANGIVTGTVTNGATVTSIVQTASAPLTNPSTTAAAAPAAATCNILHLVLGPINLNVLGLTLTTNQIVVDLTAVPGAGNLLGNLLCDVANLLNSPSQNLANLLNNLLNALQGLGL